MTLRRRTLTLLLVLPCLAILGYGARWIWIALRVATGFTAKVACSQYFLSGQDPQQTLREYVRGEIAPAGAWMSLTVGRDDVVASTFGARARAVYRPGLGCTLLAGAGEDELAAVVPPPPLPPLPADVAWPQGDAPAPTPSAAVASAIDEAFREPADAEPGRQRATRAVVIVHDGKLIAERYAPGYHPETPMQSWSMAKSVLATLVGLAALEKRVLLHAPAPVPEWRTPEDPRGTITLDQLLRQSSGLAFDEHYGAVNDVSRMLFTTPDTGAFAAARPLTAAPDTVWSYSSGTSNIVARLLRASFGGDTAALLAFARDRLFLPIGIRSAVIELDVSGTPIGSSYVYMTARDWARFGELHRLGGEWNGDHVLPDEWVTYITLPTAAAPLGQYGAHWWLNAGDPADPANRPWPSLPPETYAAQGHSGQQVVIVPTAKLVVVRLGLSLPDDGNDGTQELVAAVMAAVQTP